MNDEIIKIFLELLPKHKVCLELVHNQHRAYYLSVKDYISNRISWKDDEAKNRSITSGELWELQWYPETPVGFHHLAAPTLQELLELAKEYDTTQTPP